MEKVLKLIKDDNAIWTSRGHGLIPCPFDISPAEYIKYAEEDAQESTTRGCVNAFSNAKRAMDAQIDLLLIAFVLDKLATRKNWNIPKKLDTLNKLGIVAPRILAKFNKFRNLVEHDFVKPEHDKVEDFIDVVLLFIESTKLHLVDFLEDAQIAVEGKFDYWLDVKINRNDEIVHINYNQVNIELKPTDEYYIEFMKHYVSVAYRHG
ncbi:hypothetical protein [Thalassomonas actiniarum]|uniref:Uncharacterized protein n=1 Tax=Thalassomonas actiniarum TaxID=485447 RepID=A0AAF0C4S8_9GAMM|nr:hypothetical protein [Thalassomonas actiniarum]WDE00346.1 hypothetical protein SG35_006810 [Thalassomonas actiniarum]